MRNTNPVKSSPLFDLRQLLSEFNRSFTIIVDKELLVANAISKIKQLCAVDKITFFLQQHDTEKFWIAGTTLSSGENPANVQFSGKDKLVNWLSVNESYLLVSQSDDIVRYFSEWEQDFIKAIDAEFIYPLKVMNRLSGMVFLGRKTNDESFTEEELGLLTLLFDQAAFAIENATLYEEQSTRVKKMYRADRLAILGQLAAGAAHEIRNPLTAIRSTIQYLAKELKDPEKSAMAQELMTEVDRINKIVQGLLSFAKPSELETSKVDVNNLLQQTLSLMNNMIQKKGVEIQYDIQVDDTVVIADPEQLKQVFLNIILNAVEAMESVPNKVLRITFESSRPLDMRSRYLLISFTDSGKGISSGDIENVFNPFYTTKKDGTGLGLPISYGIINRHGGDLEISSQPNVGTKMTVKLLQMLK